MRGQLTVLLFGLLTSPVQAGLHYSGEVLAPLPVQWRGFLLDQAALRSLATPPDKDKRPHPLRDHYRAELARLEAATSLTADQLADLGALRIRLGQWEAAVTGLRAALRTHPRHFRLAANLGTAWHQLGDLTQAAEALRLAVELGPAEWRSAEESHRKLVLSRQRDKPGSLLLDDVFGIAYVGPSGQFEPGRLAAEQRVKLPPDAVARLQTLAFWLPGDVRLLRQLGELANAHGDIRTAANIFDGLVGEFGVVDAEARQRRRSLRAAVEKLGDRPLPHDERQGPVVKFRSARLLFRTFDPTTLPPINRKAVNALPWALLAQTNLAPPFRVTFPKYLRDLDGCQVTLTGYMQPLTDDLDVTAFLLIEYPVGCWFCETPEPTGMLLVELPEGRSATLTKGLVKVQGRLRLNATDAEDFLYSLREATLREAD